MRLVLTVLASYLMSSTMAFADATTLSFNFRDADLTKVIEEYAKASGTKFIIDPQVRGQKTHESK